MKKTQRSTRTTSSDYCHTIITHFPPNASFHSKRGTCPRWGRRGRSRCLVHRAHSGPRREPRGIRHRRSHPQSHRPWPSNSVNQPEGEEPAELRLAPDAAVPPPPWVLARDGENRL